MWYYCRVTRMLVSYDLWRVIYRHLAEIAGSPECWWVTTQSFRVVIPFNAIAGSPECWWVTTQSSIHRCMKSVLQGHQNVGELRHHLVCITVVYKIAGSPECWWVTTSQLLQCILLQLFCLQNVGSLRNCNDCVHPIISRYESTQ